MQPAPLPVSVTAVPADGTFQFSCHKGVGCFTECCRMLELILSPYDVLRLKQCTAMRSDAFLDNYVIIEQDPGEPFPRFYLTMIDDGRASCVFVKSDGCSVYADRPAACRAYPVGRAAMRSGDGSVSEHFVLMKEAHCHGFREPQQQSVCEYSREQGLTVYNRYNDALTELLQHDSIRKGFIPTRAQVELFILALYNLDLFRDKLFNNEFQGFCLDGEERERLKSDEELLLYAVAWVKDQLFIFN